MPARSQHHLSRRGFLKRATVLAAASATVPHLLPGRALGANDKLGVGVIGVGGRANQLIGQLPEAGRIVAVADCFRSRIEETNKRWSATWPGHADYRELLDRKDVDAVIVATGEHGRVLPCIRACQAGKDVYAEKPLTLYIAEGRALVQVVRKHQRVFQVGTQQRSMEMNRFACEFVRNGGIGKLKLVRGINYPGPRPNEGLPEEKVPDGLDWDVWLGQAPMRPYNAQLHLGWMAWRDYSGGEMTNWGAHGIDQIQWALGMDGTGPVEFWPLPSGPAGAVAFKYANGVEVHMDLDQGPHGGAVFAGEGGKIEINRNKFTTNPKDLIKNPPPKDEADKWNDNRDSRSLWQAGYHLKNWMDCIQTRQRPVANVEIGHRSVSVCHLCNLTRELGRRLQWDPARERFIGDDEANRLAVRTRRQGYELPEIA